MITAIDISEFEGYKVVGNKSGNLDNLTTINLLVGSNNSGKSRFLRKLLLTELSIQLKEMDTEGVITLVKKLKKELEALLAPYGPQHREIYQLRQQISQLPEPAYINNTQQIRQIQSELSILNQIQSSTVGDGHGGNPQIVFQTIRSVLQPYIPQFEKQTKVFEDVRIDYRKIYLPILRGLRPLQIEGDRIRFDSTKDNYRERVERDYEISDKHQVTIHTGLDMFRNVTELLLGDHDDRLKIQEFENYLSITFFQGQPVHIVPRSGKDVLYIKIGEDKQYPIYELGEGIQSVILLTYPLFFNEGQNFVFFIEEPEIHLHPGLERIFIETLRSPRFKTFQYFITTHSNHILDLTLEYDDISVYSFEKKRSPEASQFIINNVNSNHKQLLELLGVRNSSVFLSNCTIWVEGITDRLYLRKFLQVMQQGKETTFKEDYHYSFVEYAGNNITHWSFLESEDDQFSNINIEGICSKIFLIADNDGINLPSRRSKEKKIQRQQQLQQKLGDHFYLTAGLEVENMLSKDVIKGVITDMEGISTGIDFSAFDKGNHMNQYIGDFIEKNVIGITRKYRTEYGTVYDKLTFCKRAVGKIKNVDDLSEEAKNLTGRLLAFITRSNQ